MSAIPCFRKHPRLEKKGQEITAPASRSVPFKSKLGPARVWILVAIISRTRWASMQSLSAVGKLDVLHGVTLLWIGIHRKRVRTLMNSDISLRVICADWGRRQNWRRIFNARDGKIRCAGRLIRRRRGVRCRRVVRVRSHRAHIVLRVRGVGRDGMSRGMI